MSGHSRSRAMSGHMWQQSCSGSRPLSAGMRPQLLQGEEAREASEMEEWVETRCESSGIFSHEDGGSEVRGRMVNGWGGVKNAGPTSKYGVSMLVEDFVA